jgi:F-type H+-transporting ATPase subunit alpha
MAVLEKGARNVEILKQNEGSPMPVEEQVAIIYCGSTGILSKIPTAKIKEFETNFLDFMRSKHRAELDVLKSGKLTDEVTSLIKGVVADMSKNYEA